MRHMTGTCCNSMTPLKLAMDTACNTPKFAHARICAVLTYRGKVVAIATNNNPRSHPQAARWGRTAHSIYPHAELKAILRAEADGFYKWEKATLWIARAADPMNNKHMVPALARPCEGCWRAIEAYQIGNVVWTIDSKAVGEYTRG